MLEIIYPAVFVAEVETRVRSIEGVSTSTANLLGRDIVVQIERHFARNPAGWNDANDHDPGVALIELCAWLAELLLFRADAVSDCAAQHLSKLAAAALQLLSDRPLPAGCALKRVIAVQGNASDRGCPEGRRPDAVAG